MCSSGGSPKVTSCGTILSNRKKNAFQLFWLIIEFFSRETNYQTSKWKKKTSLSMPGLWQCHIRCHSQTKRKINIFELLWIIISSERKYLTSKWKRQRNIFPLDWPLSQLALLILATVNQTTENTRFVELFPKLFININYKRRVAYGGIKTTGSTHFWRADQIKHRCKIVQRLTVLYLTMYSTMGIPPSSCLTSPSR